jgi:hypothetical protein
MINPEEPCPCKSGLLFKECHGPRIKKPKVPEITKNIALKVIQEPDPNTRSVFIYDGEGTTAFTGFEVGIALTCGKCESRLVVGIPRDSIRNIIIRCKNCSAFNEA